MLSGFHSRRMSSAAALETLPGDGVSVYGEIGAHRDSDSLSEMVDLESGVLFMKLHLGDKVEIEIETERDCRICHLGLESNSSFEEFGFAIELGCSCKGDLGIAHRKCAETWFKIKGNLTCEICGSIAVNLGDEQTNQSSSIAADEASATTAPVITVETRTYWNGRRIMNFLLAGMVFSLVVSWIFRSKSNHHES